MTFEKRIEKLMYVKEKDETVYAITKGDVLDVIENNLSKQQLAILTDEQLDLLVQGTIKSLDNIDWYEWAQAGMEYHITNILGEEEEEEE